MAEKEREHFFYFIEAEIGSSSPKRLDFVQGKYSLGKLRDCDLVIPESQFKVSRTHAIITVGIDSINIVDVSSLGTGSTAYHSLGTPISSCESGIE